MRVEIDNLIGSKSEITNEDLFNLPYVSCVIKESLRLWPPASGGVRNVNIHDFKIDDYLIPNGSIIIVRMILNDIYLLNNFSLLKIFRHRLTYVVAMKNIFQIP